jgi:hypothetical protein
MLGMDNIYYALVTLVPKCDFATIPILILQMQNGVHACVLFD